MTRYNKSKVLVKMNILYTGGPGQNQVMNWK